MCLHHHYVKIYNDCAYDLLRVIYYEIQASHSWIYESMN